MEGAKQTLVARRVRVMPPPPNLAEVRELRGAARRREPRAVHSARARGLADAAHPPRGSEQGHVRAAAVKVRCTRGQVDLSMFSFQHLVYLVVFYVDICSVFHRV